MENIKHIIENFDIKHVEPINKGWSVDEKFLLIDKNNKKSILRITPKEYYLKREKQYKLLQGVSSLKLNTTKPIDFGTLNDGKVYMIISFVEGEEGINYLHGADDDLAYKLGIDAAKILKKIHEIPFDNPEFTWKDLYENKLVRKLNDFQNCGKSIKMQDEIIQYYKNNLYLMYDRPLRFCHGDFHLGNMLIDKDTVSIIDFEKAGLADPYDEFKVYRWSVDINEYFQTALINEYFNYEIPEDFWKVLKFYTTENMISQLPWAMKHGQEDVKIAYEMIDKQLDWYDNLRLDIPKWYKGII